MAKLARDNFDRAATALINNDTSKVEKIESVEEVINFLNHGITRHLVKINALDLDMSDAKFIGRLFHVTNDIERIGDHAVNLSEAMVVRNNEKLAISDEAIAELEAELALYMVHGFLHSAGEDDLTPAARRRMRKREKECLDELAERFYFSRFHMMRRFKEETGSTIHTYVSERRLLMAREMISKGITTTEACFQSGFQSYAAFARAYSKFFGTTHIVFFRP